VSGVEHLALSPDGARRSHRDSEGIRRALWDVKTGNQVRALQSAYLQLPCRGFSPDSLNMITENLDGSATAAGCEAGQRDPALCERSRPSFFSADGSRVLMAQLGMGCKDG